MRQCKRVRHKRTCLSLGTCQKPCGIDLSLAACQSQMPSNRQRDLEGTATCISTYTHRSRDPLLRVRETWHRMTEWLLSAAQRLVSIGQSDCARAYLRSLPNASRRSHISSTVSGWSKNYPAAAVTHGLNRLEGRVLQALDHLLRRISSLLILEDITCAEVQQCHSRRLHIERRCVMVRVGP